MTKYGRQRSFRRTRRTAVGAGSALLLTLALTDPGGARPGQDAEPFQAGTGSAIALGYRVNPSFGQLSFGITAGESVAGHQNTAAQAQSKAVNLGVIGVTLAAEGCNGAEPSLAAEKQPQPLIVSSEDEGAAEGKHTDEAGAITMDARADKTPFAEAITTIAPLGDAAVAQISGGRTTATSGVVADGVREARAITEIGELRLLDGLVVIGDMRWEAAQRSGSETVDTAGFSLGSLKVAGQSFPIPGDAMDQVALLNEALNSVGLTVSAPQVRQEEGIVFVDPLKIGVVPSELRDGLLLGPILTALQPVREEVVKTIFRLGCDGDLSGLYTFPSSTIVTLLDLAVGSVSGAGSLLLELGGVQATTAEIDGFDGLGVIPPLTPVTPSAPSSPSLGSSGSPTVGAPTTPAATDADTGSTDRVVATPISDFVGKRGGALLGVGAGGLLMLLASAEGDRRKMRRAQREIPLEA